MAWIFGDRGEKKRASIPRSLALYFTGHGPWMIFFMALVAVCFLAPDVYGAMTALLARGILPAIFLSTIGWSGVLTFACFRAGLGMRKPRAAAATALFYLGFSSVILGWYLALNQIQPQVPFLHGL